MNPAYEYVCIYTVSYTELVLLESLRAKINDDRVIGSREA